MHRRATAKEPPFFWQGLIILLPVFALAGFGFLSLVQDQRLVDEEARRRAEELARQLSNALGQDVSRSLAKFEKSARLWGEIQLYRPDRAVVDAGSNSTTAAQTDIDHWRSEWRSTYPGLKPGAVLIPPIRVAESGQLLAPREWDPSPTPPRWLLEMDDRVARMWEQASALTVHGARADGITAAWQDFVRAEPGPEALSNAQLALLRLEIRTNAVSVGEQKLVAFARSSGAVGSESGLPLSSVALASALAITNEPGFSPAFYGALQDEIRRSPSLLAPYFIQEAARRGEGGSGEARLAASALAEVWALDEHARVMARAVREQVALRGRIRTNLWLTVEEGRWLAMIAPLLPQADRSQTASRNGPDRTAMVIDFAPLGVVQKAFQDAARASALSLPGYAGLRVEFEGEPVLDTAVPDKKSQPPRLLARTGGVLSPAVREPDDSAINEPEALASRPGFSLGIYLSDPAALYRYQQRRSLWLSSVILAVAATAAWGLARAKRAFDREHQLSELKSNFVASVSHELRAPIASIRLMAESLERGKVHGEGRPEEYFHFIGQECRRLSGLIANVLDFSRIEQGRKRYELEPTNVVQLFDETVRLMESYGRERGIAVIPTVSGLVNFKANGSTPGPDCLEPELDGRAVQQALINVIDNAIKHSQTGSSVRVRLELPEVKNEMTAPGVIRFAVEDNGPGIPVAERERIFERFYRLGSELRRETEGVGIGLSIVKHVVEAHGGRVWVEGELGKGSTFLLEFPCRATPNKT